MKLQIWQLIRLAYQVLHQIYYYLHYAQQVFTYLFSTFPFNVVAILIVALFFIKYFRRSQQQSKMIKQLAKLNAIKMKQSSSQTKLLECVRLQISNELKKLKVKIEEGEKIKDDEQIINGLQRQEVQLYQAYQQSMENQQVNMDKELKAIIESAKDLIKQQEQMDLTFENQTKKRKKQ